MPLSLWPVACGAMGERRPGGATCTPLRLGPAITSGLGAQSCRLVVGRPFTAVGRSGSSRLRASCAGRAGLPVRSPFDRVMEVSTPVIKAWSKSAPAR
jgi:hypothetical protein